jgi:negative regulator of replication initiation
MRMHQIEVDDEVFSYLQRKAQPFLDTPNTVLRRELPLRQATRINGSTLLGAEKTLDSLPIPAGTPKALREILEVIYQMHTSGRTRSDATNYIARKLGVTPQTIIDKYTRQLGLTASQFDRLLDHDQLPQLKALLKERFRAHSDVVDQFFARLSR